jgi:hypothetical protein
MGRCDKIHESLFSKINTANACISKRVRTVTLVGLAAVVVVVLGGAFMLLYNQGTGIGTKIGVVHQRITSVHEDLHEVELKVITVQEQVKAAQQVQSMMKEDIKEIKENNR